MKAKINVVSFNPNQPVKTASGLDAEIIAVDALGGFPIIALVKTKSEGSILVRYNSIGRAFFEDERNPLGFDLVNVPQQHEAFAVIPIDPKTGEITGAPHSIHNTEDGAIGALEYKGRLNRACTEGLTIARLEWGW